MRHHRLRFRQVHLDFHTSPVIPDIGAKFDKNEWQEALHIGHVDSITCFSKCHHGWSYHATKVGKVHPNLSFDLLRAQFDAAKEIDVRVPIYISSGLDGVAGEEHPEWREMGADGRFAGWISSITEPGFLSMCFHSPYLDYLCEQVVEAVRLFPECDGVFSDITVQSPCCCKYCLDYMRENGLDPIVDKDRRRCAKAAMERYYRAFTAACRCGDPDMPVYHNSSLERGNRSILQYFSHLELESLPTGGWGYDHYPLSAKHAWNTGLDFLGMTGKFHTGWGEFGGYKHPNALRYECMAIIANGSKCSVGDQLHPNGEMDLSTYTMVGEAYAEVEAKEKWCENVIPLADIALLSSEVEAGTCDPDTGAARVFLEDGFLFDTVLRDMDLASYRLLILPDVITVDGSLEAKIDGYLKAGGKLLLTGKSGLRKCGDGFAFDIGADYQGESPFQPDYLESGSVLAPDFLQSPLVMYMKSQQVRPTTGEVLARIREPYFNRKWSHFCSHRHAPPAGLSEFPAAVWTGSILYLAHPVFSMYYAQGAVAYRNYIANAIRLMLGEEETIRTNMPSTARVNLMEQRGENRYVLHLLFANTVARGAPVKLSPEGFVWDSEVVEVIENLIPLRDVEVSMRLPKQVQSVTLEPQGMQIPFSVEEGRVKVKVDEFTCHQMVVLHY